MTLICVIIIYEFSESNIIASRGNNHQEKLLEFWNATEEKLANESVNPTNDTIRYSKKFGLLSQPRWSL